MKHYQAAALGEVARAILAAAGSKQPEIDTVADHLVMANLSGHDSHGVGMLPDYARFIDEGLYFPNQTPEVVEDRTAVLVVDGHRGLGQAMALRALSLGVEKARQAGAAIVGLRNSGHVGRIGAYSEFCAAEGLASHHFVNVVDHTPIVAPYGGSDARFVTNPFSAGLPDGRGGASPMLDMATSTIAMGKARVARNKGVPVPEGTLMDAEGRMTTDPSAIVERKEGALTAFGQHKGSGLAIICELFAGALTGARTMQPAHERKGSIINNMLSVIIDPGALGDPSATVAETKAAIDWIKASPVAPGFDRVRMPGDPESEAREQRTRSGVPLDDRTVADIIAAGVRFGLDQSTLEAAFTGGIRA
ncbi:MAG: malate/lactate/ureidoglycolate dehydrogenase [Geminicoccaceae bacterium]